MEELPERNLNVASQLDEDYCPRCNRMRSTEGPCRHMTGGNRLGTNTEDDQQRRIDVASRLRVAWVELRKIYGEAIVVFGQRGADDLYARFEYSAMTGNENHHKPRQRGHRRNRKEAQD